MNHTIVDRARRGLRRVKGGDKATGQTAVFVPKVAIVTIFSILPIVWTITSVGSLLLDATGEGENRETDHSSRSARRNADSQLRLWSLSGRFLRSSVRRSRWLRFRLLRRRVRRRLRSRLWAGEPCGLDAASSRGSRLRRRLLRRCAALPQTELSRLSPCGDSCCDSGCDSCCQSVRRQRLRPLLASRAAELPVRSVYAELLVRAKLRRTLLGRFLQRFARLPGSVRRQRQLHGRGMPQLRRLRRSSPRLPQRLFR